MDGIKLTDREIAVSFSSPHWAEAFPPVLGIDQAAKLLGVPVGTLRDWRSRGLLAQCSRRVGKRVFFYRDRLIKTLFND